MLGIFGILVLGGTVLLSVAVLLVPMDELAQSGALDRFPPEVDPSTAIQYAAACMGVCGGVVGLIYLVLTPFVWKGNRGGIVAAAVVVGLTQLMTVVLATANFLQGGIYGIAGGVFYLAIAAVLGVALMLLIKSVAALRRREEQLQSAAYQASWQAYQAQQARSPQSPGEGGSGWQEPPSPPAQG
jgi:hypothetical protein